MSEIDSLPGLLPLTDLDELERVAIELGAWGDAVRFVAATNPDRPAFQQQPDSHLLFPAPRGGYLNPSELAPPRLAPCAGGGRPRTARPKCAPTYLRHLVPVPLG